MWRLRYNTVAVGGRRGWRGLGFQLRSVVHIWHNGHLTRRRHTHTATTNESDDGVEERRAVFAGNRETGACGECSNTVVWACGAAAPCVAVEPGRNKGERAGKRQMGSSIVVVRAAAAGGAGWCGGKVKLALSPVAHLAACGTALLSQVASRSERGTGHPLEQARRRGRRCRGCGARGKGPMR